MSAGAPLGTDSTWSEDLGRGRTGWSLITRGVAVILLIMLVVRARRSVVGVRTSGVTPPAPDRGASWQEELAGDRLFERSLVVRGIAAILLIALLIVVRQLLS